ncbi:hypothetical protein EJB05_35731, partial [Eragrostis curvula]
MFSCIAAFGQSSSTSTFGQSSFGTQQQGFGQATAANNPFAPKPFGSPNTTFGAQTGSSPFGNASTGVFGLEQSTPTFGSSTPAFGASPTPAFGATFSTFGSGSSFGQKPSFGSFGSSPSQSTPFGSMFQQTQPTFGSSIFRATTTPALGATTTPAFSATTTLAFGTTTTPAFSGTTKPAFGSTSTPLFGATTTPAFGSTAFGSSTHGFGNSGTTAFGVSSPGFGVSSTPTFGQSTGSFGFGSSPSDGQPTTSFGTSTFGATPSPFGAQTFPFGSKPGTAFGQTPFGNQAGGIRINPCAQTPDDSATSGVAAAKLDSISAMPEYKGKSHEELRTPSQSNMVTQPAPVSHPYGTLPAMPQMSIGNAGHSPSVQYGISSLPVAEKPLPSRILSTVVPRHWSQRRIKLHPRKYNPIRDVKVPFFDDDEESPATPKADGFFIPRENPRNLIIRPIDQWPSRSEIDRQSVYKDAADLEKCKGVCAESARDKTATSPSWPSPVENGNHHEPEAKIRHRNGASVERLMPKLPHTDYFTEPGLEELAAKERAEPGYCSRVIDFVVGRHGYGSIKFLGATDVRGLDLESIVEFNNREVIVYKDDSKKPPVGEGLNKAAEVTLLNIKCMNKKTGEQYHEGPRVDKYMEMLIKKADEQGAEFLSFDAAKGEWKFRVEHFSAYGLW